MSEDRARPTRTAKPDLKARPRFAERAAEAAIKLVALLSIAAVLLILVFVGKEALPLLFSADVHKEVTPATLFAGQEGAHVWQPVSDVPKYDVWPLFVGSIKV